MCGICGFVNFNGKAINSGAILTQMSQAIAHRGPDDTGYALWRGNRTAEFYSSADSPPEVRELYPLLNDQKGSNALVGLSHRRFSIIDTSVSGHQPFVDLKTGTVIIFNGEIFNYIELRKELEEQGHGPFFTKSDTEVVLVAFRAWGTNCFQRFNGFWAIVILDPTKRNIILSRDRFGQKSLYTRQEGDTLFFSSEIKGLAEIERLPELSINHDAAMLYLLYDRRNTLEGCMYKEIKLFPSGTTAIININSNSEHLEHFWKYPEERLTDQDISLDEAINKFEKTFQEAVKIRMRSDVPICANLSGGIDSSAIVAVAQDALPEEKKLSTNLIRYSDAPELDENYYANKVVEKTRCNHHELFLSGTEFWDQIQTISKHLEEPVHTPAFFSQWFAWKHIRKKGFKVILHGSAADELLIGYPYLRDIHDVSNVNRLKLNKYLLSHKPNDWRTHMRMAKRFFQGEVFPHVSNPLRRLNGQIDRRIWNNDYSPYIFEKYFNIDFLNQTQTKHDEFNHYYINANTSVEARIRADFECLRIPFWNNTMDKSMMSIPVEVRMPFLDYKLVDLAMRLPVSYLHYRSWTKYILRKAVTRYVPEDVNWCQQKRGFTAPVKKWLEDKKSFVSQLLQYENSKLKHFVNIENVLKDLPVMPERVLWRIVNFAVWLRNFVSSN